ncbi:MAG: hypothetical protein ABJE66_18700 [Deltaproteobacteria bacterium]
MALADDGGNPHHYGRQVRFVGIHPIPRSEGGGMCNIEGPHVHIYAANKLEYRDHDGDHYFVGDPVAYKYDGPKYAYKGPHPIHVDAVVGGEPDTEYCYIEGPHYHYFRPADDQNFRMAGDAYFYVGEPPQAFIEARPMYVGINATYRPLVYTRPVVEVDAPTGWIGARAEFVTPSVVVETPGVIVEDHRGWGHHKHDEVIVGGGAVVGAGIGVTVVAPPPPSISIGIGVGIGVGGGTVVHEREHEHEHHDNGRHRGWR